ncbi:hypothetical protein EM595_1267 [Duffyella gerundensis]|uniref:Uncharacterized protein n=1 Tax=Duffyella gerundensis TaxID=1619313 RepID=A0A0U5E8G4_9GAMM|nr:hypothetical protein EM595_1267 [Duffyella gerundensis]
MKNASHRRWHFYFFHPALVHNVNAELPARLRFFARQLHEKQTL